METNGESQVIRRWRGNGWEGVGADPYKAEPESWSDVTRSVLHDSERSKFQARYFEIAPGGRTTHERHEHEHFVVVVRGNGRVLLDGEWHELAPMDAVYVKSMQAHQFVNPSESPFGILCVVDRERDAPQPLDAPPAPVSER